MPDDPGWNSLNRRRFIAAAIGTGLQQQVEAAGQTNPLPSVRPPPPTVGLSAPPAGAGCSGTLSAYTGPKTITTAGTLIENKSIAGTVIVRANNVGFKNCKFAGFSGWGIDAENSSRLWVDHCTMIGDGGNSCILTGGDWKVTNSDLTGMDNGIMCQEGTGLAKGNYLHGLGGSADAHVDGIQLAGGQNGVIIRGNWIEAWDTSCVFIKCDWGPIKNVVVENNTLKNTSGKKTAATVYSYSVGTKLATDIHFRNNRMEKGNWFYLATDNSTPEFTGNVDFVTGAAIKG